MANYKAISATSQVKLGAAKLRGIFVSGAASTPKITVYDSTVASTDDPVVLAEFVPAAATAYNFIEGLYCSRGLYVVLSGTVTATVIFE
jgi:hypothetical protein